MRRPALLANKTLSKIHIFYVFRYLHVCHEKWNSGPSCPSVHAFVYLRVCCPQSANRFDEFSGYPLGCEALQFLFHSKVPRSRLIIYTANSVTPTVRGPHLLSAYFLLTNSSFVRVSLKTRGCTSFFLAENGDLLLRIAEPSVLHFLFAAASGYVFMRFYIFAYPRESKIRWGRGREGARCQQMVSAGKKTTTRPTCKGKEMAHVRRREGGEDWSQTVQGSILLPYHLPLGSIFCRSRVRLLLPPAYFFASQLASYYFKCYMLHLSLEFSPQKCMMHISSLVRTVTNFRKR